MSPVISLMIVDEQGIVRHRHESRLGLTYQTADDLRAALDLLAAPGHE